MREENDMRLSVIIIFKEKNYRTNVSGNTHWKMQV